MTLENKKDNLKKENALLINDHGESYITTEQASLSKPEMLFILGLIILIASVLVWSENLSMALYRIAGTVVGFIPIIIGYSLFRKVNPVPFIRKIILTHFIISFVIAFVALVILPNLEQTNRYNYTDNTVSNYLDDSFLWLVHNSNVLISILTLIFLITQLVWIVLLLRRKLTIGITGK